jgi:hypothetical protein
MMPETSYVAYTPFRVDRVNEPEEQEGASKPGLDDDLGELTRTITALEEKKKEFQWICEKADQVPEYAAIVNNASVLEDIPNDCWGGLIFTIVKDFPDLRVGRAVLEGKVRVAGLLCMFAINMFLQLYLLGIIGQLLMLPDMLEAQNLYKFFHDKVYSDQHLNPTAFEEMSHGHKGHLCQMALSQRIFVRIIVFLWVTNNVGEVRENWAKTTAVFSLPFLPEGMDTRLMVRDLPERPESDLCIVCLNMRGRMILLTLVFIPKFIIAVILTFMGVNWLMAAESAGDLILNSLSLAFVTKIDEVLAQVFFPSKLQKNIATLCIMMPPKDHDDEEEMIHAVWDYFYMAMTFVLVCLFVETSIRREIIIPNWTDDVTEPCIAYLNSQVPWCAPWQKHCFPEK